MLQNELVMASETERVRGNVEEDALNLDLDLGNLTRIKADSL